MNQAAVIRVEEVSFAYGKRMVLEEVSLEIGSGDFIWIVGPNGGGKTTLVKLLVGLIKPKSGLIEVMGKSPSRARSQVGYMPQQIHIDPKFPMTVTDVVLTGRLGLNVSTTRKADGEAALAAIEQVSLMDQANETIASLSGGQQRRMFIARALACEPEILILDEPMANLDAVMEKQVRELLFKLNQKLTVLMVSHDPALVSESIKSVVCVNRRVAIHQTYEVDIEMMGELYEGPVRMIRHDRDSHGEKS